MIIAHKAKGAVDIETLELKLLKIMKMVIAMMSIILNYYRLYGGSNTKMLQNGAMTRRYRI